MIKNAIYNNETTPKSPILLFSRRPVVPFRNTGQELRCGNA